MSLQPADITIAVTVFDRRVFVEQAIQSALNQTVPVKVMVVEDCSPDPALESFVRSRFAPGLRYIRNPARRGLFDNWNACIEQCQTPWLSILHDDDYFLPNFVETLIKLHDAAPGRGLYFGNSVVVNRAGRVVPFGQPVVNGFWQEIDLRALADANILGFAGHLFPAHRVRALGGFRAHSRYCGDWEMWFNLVARHGGAHTGTDVVTVRFYEDWRKGTSRVNRAGQNHLATIVQRKRNYHLLRETGRVASVDIQQFRGESGVSLRFLLWHGGRFSQRILDYNVALFLGRGSVSATQRLPQVFFRAMGRGFLKLCCRICGWLRPRASA